MHLVARLDRRQRDRKAVRNKKSQVIDHEQKAASHRTGHGNVVPRHPNNHGTSSQTALAAPH
jgi:hypothetical protein